MILTALLLTSTMASATVVRLRSEEEMARAAAAIVRAEVVGVTTRVHGGNLVLTDVRLRVERLLKGEPALQKEVTLVQLGGCVEARCTRVAGTPELRVGERWVVFLERGGEGYVEQGIGAGTYRVLQSGDTTLVERQLGKVTFAAVEGKAARIITPPPVAAPEPLSSFESRILGYLAK